jgi:hypothetical protein
MSLDTVLKIGKALRKSKDNLKYFKYVAPCPVKNNKDGSKSYPICITIPVKEDFSFDWENMGLTPEYKRDELYYLKFKTSNNDGMVKYVFGDIFYQRFSKIKNDNSIESEEKGFYRLANPSHSNAAYRPSSFNRGFNDYKKLISINADNKVIKNIHEALENEINKVETVLEYSLAFERYLCGNNSVSIFDFFKDIQLIRNYEQIQIFETISSQNRKKLNIEKDNENFEELDELQKQKLSEFKNFEIFIHFDFNSKNWYDFKDELVIINDKILADFVEETTSGLVLTKTLYKTLCSGDKKNDMQFPEFNVNNKFKSKAFNNEELQDLFYAIDYSGKGKLIFGTDIKKIILPRGNNLDADDYSEFLAKQNEDITKSRNKGSDSEPLFNFTQTDIDDIVSFDIIFCKKGTFPAPDIDLIEISSIEKSKLRQTMERINDISQETKQKRADELSTKKELSGFKIEYSFRNILGSYYYDEKTKKVTVKANPKYQSHILKVLPLIYTDNYYNDEILLPVFIQNVETSVRFGDPKYTFLKYDLMFLYKIQNDNNFKNDKFMEITNSKSYQIGLKIGKIAKPLKNAINSFEKSYVGLISRRTNSIDECAAFLNEIDQKLIMHAKHYGKSISVEARNELANLSISEYDKEKIVFGFFEGYFKYEAKDKKKDFFNRLEKLVADNKDSEELQNEVEQLNILIEDIKIETN